MTHRSVSEKSSSVKQWFGYSCVSSHYNYMNELWIIFTWTDWNKHLKFWIKAHIFCFKVMHLMSWPAKCHSDSKGAWGQHGVQLGLTGPRWGPCCLHELCYLGGMLCTRRWATCPIQNDNHEAHFTSTLYAQNSTSAHQYSISRVNSPVPLFLAPITFNPSAVK